MRGVGGTSRLVYTIADYSNFRIPLPTPSERIDPDKRILPGPIGLFRHGGGASEYKDIFLEANPKEDRLLTVLEHQFSR